MSLVFTFMFPWPEVRARPRCNLAQWYRLAAHAHVQMVKTNGNARIVTEVVVDRAVNTHVSRVQCCVFTSMVNPSTARTEASTSVVPETSLTPESPAQLLDEIRSNAKRRYRSLRQSR